MLTFLDIQNEIKRRSTRDQSGTAFDTAIKNVANTSLFRLSREALWKTLRRATTFTCATSTEEFVLSPQVSDRFFMWHEEYGYPYVMKYIPEQKFLSMGIDKDSTGTPTHYRTWTTDMIKAQPSAASAIAVSSSSASDTTQKINVFGIVSGYPDYEELSLNGTTAVSSSKSFTTVDRIVKDSTTVGRITATSNTAAVTVAVIPAGDTTAGLIYRKVKIYPLNDSSFTMNVYYYKDPYRLVNDNDVHELGHDFDEALILLATAKMNYEQNKEDGDKYFGLYKDELKSLRKTNVDKIDWFPKLQRQGQSSNVSPLIHPFLAYNQAGSYYGPRTY